MDSGTTPQPLGDAAGSQLAAEALAAHPDFARLTSAVAAPDGALRARFNAVIADLLLLGIFSQILITAIAGHSLSSVDGAGWFLVIEFAYFFCFELARGQTIGKRIFHVRVASVDGQPVTAKQIALRNAVRPLDALPFLYASGLISLIRTGPGRRQRMGDAAAGTTVVVSDNGRPLPTPRWLLPAWTIVATLASILIIVAVANRGGTQTPQLRQTAPSEPPAEGEWSGVTNPEQQEGWVQAGSGATTIAIRRDCGGGSCGISLTYRVPGEAPLTGRLVETGGAWLALLPSRLEHCARGEGMVQSAIALRFTGAGHVAEGDRTAVSRSPVCGFGAERLSVAARLAG